MQWDQIFHRHDLGTLDPAFSLIKKWLKKQFLETGCQAGEIQFATQFNKCQFLDTLYSSKNHGSNFSAKIFCGQCNFPRRCGWSWCFSLLSSSPSSPFATPGAIPIVNRQFSDSKIWGKRSALIHTVSLHSLIFAILRREQNSLMDHRLAYCLFLSGGIFHFWISIEKLLINFIRKDLLFPQPSWQMLGCLPCRQVLWQI